MHKMGVVGDFEDVAYFSAAGCTCFYPKAEKNATEIVKELAKNDYAVIFVSDEYYAQTEVVRKKYLGLPIIVPLPLGKNFGTGRELLAQRLKGAAGISID